MTSELLQVKNNHFPHLLTKELFKDTLDESCITCDLVIKCGEELMEFKCHRWILASASDFLCEIITSSDSSKLPVLILPEIQPKTLQHVLTFIYNGEIQFDDTSYDDFIEGCQLLGIKLESGKMEVDHYEVTYIEEEQNEEAEIVEVTKNYEETEIQDIIREVPEENIVQIPSSNTPMQPRSVKKPKPRHVTPTKPNFKRNFSEIGFEEEMVEEIKSSIKRKSVKRVNVNSFLKEAKQTVREVYENINIKLPKPIDTVVENTQFVFEGKTLIGAAHVCGFCKAPCILLMDQNESWSNGILKKHVETVHKARFRVSFDAKEKLVSNVNEQIVLLENKPGEIVQVNNQEI